MGGFGVNSECSAESMIMVSEQFGKSNGVQLRHYVLSFAPCELTNPKVANEIGGSLQAYGGNTENTARLRNLQTYIRFAKRKYPERIIAHGTK